MDVQRILYYCIKQMTDQYDIVVTRYGEPLCKTTDFALWSNLHIKPLPTIYRLFVQFDITPSIEVQFKMSVDMLKSKYEYVEIRKESGLVIIRGNTLDECLKRVKKGVATDWDVVEETQLSDISSLKQHRSIGRIVSDDRSMANIVLFDMEFYTEPNTKQNSIAEIAGIRDTVRPLQKFKAITTEGLNHSLFAFSKPVASSEIEGAISEKEALYKFLCFCYNTDKPEDVVDKKRLILVAHNGRTTDYPVLSNRLAKYGFDAWFDLRYAICLDTKDILKSDGGSWKIDDLIQKEFGRKEIHRALSDTVDMYDLLVKKLGASNVHLVLYQLALDYQDILPEYDTVENMIDVLNKKKIEDIRDMYMQAHLSTGSSTKRQQLIKNLIIREVFARSRDIVSAREWLDAIPESLETLPVKKSPKKFETEINAVDELHDSLFWLNHATTDALKTVPSVKTGSMIIMKESAINALNEQKIRDDHIPQKYSEKWFFGLDTNKLSQMLKKLKEPVPATKAKRVERLVELYSKH
jgi:hypothetical protein